MRQLLQKTRFPDSGSLNVEHYTFFWQGRRVDECWGHGVEFAIKNTLLRMIEYLAGDTERILTVCISTYEGLINPVWIYAATLQDQFYAS